MEKNLIMSYEELIHEVDKRTIAELLTEGLDVAYPIDEYYEEPDDDSPF